MQKTNLDTSIESQKAEQIPQETSKPDEKELKTLEIATKAIQLSDSTEQKPSAGFSLALPDFDSMSTQHKTSSLAAPPPSKPSKSKKRKKQAAPSNIFKPAPRPTQNTTPPFTIPAKIASHVHLQGSYQIQGEMRPCIKLPSETTLCGPTSALMLMSHFLHADKNLELNNSFWSAYTQRSMASQSDLLQILADGTNLLKLGYTLKANFYDLRQHIEEHPSKKEGIEYIVINDHKYDLLTHLKKIHDSYQSPIIVSITNPKIYGHWIVIDHISDKSVFLRDPYAGQAYEISHEELFDNWATKEDFDDEVNFDCKNDEVKIIYIEKPKLEE